MVPFEPNDPRLHTDAYVCYSQIDEICVECALKNVSLNGSCRWSKTTKVLRVGFVWWCSEEQGAEVSKTLPQGKTLLFSVRESVSHHVVRLQQRHQQHRLSVSSAISRTASRKEWSARRGALRRGLLHHKLRHDAKRKQNSRSSMAVTVSCRQQWPQSKEHSEVCHNVLADEKNVLA